MLSYFRAGLFLPVGAESYESPPNRNFPKRVAAHPWYVLRTYACNTPPTPRPRKASYLRTTGSVLGLNCSLHILYNRIIEIGELDVRRLVVLNENKT